MEQCLSIIRRNARQRGREGDSIERLESSLFSAVREPCLVSMCRLSIEIEGLPRIIGPSKAAASPHKGGTRWNNAIFVEEEARRRSTAHSDVGKEIKKEGTPTTEGREKKREEPKKPEDEGRTRDREGGRRTSRSLMGYPPRTSMQRHCR